MALLPSDASEMTKPKKPGTRMEKCLFGQQELDVPEIMMEDVRYFDILRCRFNDIDALFLMILLLMMLHSLL